MNDLIRTARIQQLNDECRADTSRYQLSAWLSLWHLEDQVRIKQLVKEFGVNNSHEELAPDHEYGEFFYASHRIIWKIHYYENDLSVPSPDPADHTRTNRVLVVTLASECQPHPPQEKGSIKPPYLANFLRKLWSGGKPCQ